jgi:hypothetical protein
MDSKLAEALVAKGVLGAGTEVEARYLGAGLSGKFDMLVSGGFTIEGASLSGGTVYFTLTSTADGSQKRLPALAVTSIDGMDPERFASVYNVKADGGEAKVGKRRGRKPKDRSQAPVSE